MPAPERVAAVWTMSSSESAGAADAGHHLRAVQQHPVLLGLAA